MGINVSFPIIGDKQYIRYEDDKGGILWLPEGYEKESLKSLFDQIKHIYRVYENE